MAEVIERASMKLKYIAVKTFGFFLFSFLTFTPLARAQSEPEKDAKETKSPAAKFPAQEARSKLLQLYLSLMDFEADYGTFPTEDTVKEVDDSQLVDHLAKGSSNRFLALLIAGGYMHPNAETHFSLPFPAINAITADQQVNKGKALEAGECSITYNTGLSTSDEGGIPLLIYPVVPDKNIFDAKAAGGKAYVLRIDGELKIYDVAEDGSVTVGGKSFFDPTNPMWAGKMKLCHPLVKKLAP